MPKFQDLTGLHFGRLTVLERAENGSHGRTRWRCLCVCGNECFTTSARLKSGDTQSCGCLKKEIMRSGKAKIMSKSSKGHRTHGLTNSRLYSIWNGMKQRCSNPNRNRYKHYGGRGIKVCEEWEKSFETFRAWALANGYAEDLSIDRIDCDGNYCPENCRWATIKEQQNNRRNNKRLEVT